jgi:hypothetical protein
MSIEMTMPPSFDEIMSKSITFHSINGGRQFFIDAPGHDWDGHCIKACNLGKFLNLADREDFNKILVA